MKILGYPLAIAVLVAFGCGEAPEQATPADAKPDTSSGMATAKPSKALDKQAPATASPPARADSDTDGVPDELDQCAETPAGAAVGPDGCIKDQDFDGVADNQDACPGSPRDQLVDDRGCPPRLKTAREFPVAISFASGSAEVDASLVMTALTEPLRIARSYPNSQVRVYAYTDSSGSVAANQTLSQQRAESVAAIVVSEGGIALSRVKAVGRGEADPIASNETRAGRAANRRIVVVLVPAGAA